MTYSFIKTDLILLDQDIFNSFFLFTLLYSGYLTIETELLYIVWSDSPYFPFPVLQPEGRAGTAWKL